MAMADIIASKAITNTMAIVIYEIEPHGEYVVFAYHDGTKADRRRKSAIRYNGMGKPYFMTKGQREYLHEYIRVN
jgi:hypothetical protein